VVVSTYLLDTIAPAAPVLQHTPDRTDWTWRFAIEAKATAECSIDGGPWTACASPLPGGPAGETVRFEVRAVDRAGNRSAISRTTVTPTMGTTLAPPSDGPPATSPVDPPPDLTPPSRTRSPVVELIVNAGAGATRPPVSALAPSGRGGAEVEATTMLRRFRPEDGPFAGPVRELLQAAAKTTTIPVLVILLVIAFVAVQNRIDRRDPKLAAAPLRNEPEYVEFD
jgi:hypothetical protein